VTDKSCRAVLSAPRSGHRPDRCGDEALTAVSVACLTIYDMIKAVDAASVSKAFIWSRKGRQIGHYRAAD